MTICIKGGGLKGFLVPFGLGEGLDRPKNEIGRKPNVKVQDEDRGIVVDVPPHDSPLHNKNNNSPPSFA